VKRTVTLLALTRMRSGFCLAGVEPETGDWIRPVKEFGSIQANDLFYPDRTPLAVFDQAEWSLGRPRPQPPHVEDWTCDFVRQRPARVARLTGIERAALLERAAELDVSPVLTRHARSLILTAVDDFTATFDFDPVTRKLDPRLVCPALGLTTPLPVTDLRWRALGRARYTDTGRCSLPWSRLRAELGAERVYLAFGLSREFDGRLWPLVIGVHCVPDFEAVVDFRNP